MRRSVGIPRVHTASKKRVWFATGVVEGLVKCCAFPFDKRQCWCMCVCCGLQHAEGGVTCDVRV